MGKRTRVQKKSRRIRFIRMIIVGIVVECAFM